MLLNTDPILIGFHDFAVPVSSAVTLYFSTLNTILFGQVHPKPSGYGSESLEQLPSFGYRSVFRIRIRIGSGFRGVLDPDPDPGL